MAMHMYLAMHNVIHVRTLYYLHCMCLEQLNKIDEDIKRSLTDKLTILQSMQGRAGDRATLRRRGGVETKDTENETLSDPRDYVAIAIEQGRQGHF